MITLITKSYVAPLNSLVFSYCLSLTMLLQLLWLFCSYEQTNKSSTTGSLQTLLSPAWNALATNFLMMPSLISLKSVLQNHFLNDVKYVCIFVKYVKFQDLLSKISCLSFLSYYRHLFIYLSIYNKTQSLMIYLDCYLNSIESIR